MCIVVKYYWKLQNMLYVIFPGLSFFNFLYKCAYAQNKELHYHIICQKVYNCEGLGNPSNFPNLPTSYIFLPFINQKKNFQNKN